MKRKHPVRMLPFFTKLQIVLKRRPFYSVNFSQIPKKADKKTYPCENLRKILSLSTDELTLRQTDFDLFLFRSVLEYSYILFEREISMNKTTEKTTERTEERRPGIFEKFGSLTKGLRTERGGGLLYELASLTVALLFARCHFIFGAYPIGIAFVAALPTRVFSALIGAALGSLTLGADGIIYGVTSLLTVFLRIITSGADKKGAARLFGEGYLLRASAAIIGGFITAAYELLLSGFTVEGVLFGATMVLVPPALVFVFSGVFGSEIGVSELLYEKRPIFSLSGVDEAKKYKLLFFQGSALFSLLLLTMSLASFELFGINLAYVFVSLITLLVARRFGAARALAVGFVSSLGVSGSYAVSFALAGLSSGLLFGLGPLYALVGGGAALSAWSAYSGGVLGFVSTLPEYAIAATLVAPLLKNLSTEMSDGEAEKCGDNAKDMVGTVALNYKNKYRGGLLALEESLSSLGGIVRGFAGERASLSAEEYEAIIIDTANEQCSTCTERTLCEKENIFPAQKGVKKIASKLLRGERLTSEDMNGEDEFCHCAQSLAERIGKRVAEAEREKYKISERSSSADEYELISKLINESRLSDERETAHNPTLSELLSDTLKANGLSDGVARVFGERRPHVIIAAEDDSGDRIASRKLREDIESRLGIRLGVPEFFKRGKMALLECGAARSYRILCASALTAGEGDEVSGDTVSVFESCDDRFYALISDGMGRGEVAKETSSFAASFIEKALSHGATKETVLALLSEAIRRRGEECSASVDLFEFDLINGSTIFLKSGAAPSFVKRGSSIFRLRSQTAPIGLMKKIDTERIAVEVKGEDFVIMLSDGICQSAEDAPWLLELLSRPAPTEPRAYADLILKEAKAHTRCRDDMSVIVLKIEKL